MRCCDRVDVVAGSLRAPCSLCSAECWVAPSSQTVAPGAQVVCMPCWLRIAKPGDVVQPVAPEQCAEVVAYLRGTEGERAS